MKKLWLLLLIAAITQAAYSPGTFIADPTTPTNQAKVQSAAPANTDKALTVILQPNSSSLAVTGTFWQATQPVSIATAPVLVAGSAIIGKVGVDQTTPGTTNAVSLAQIGSTTTASGNGVVGAGVQRVAIASDNTAFSVNATLQAGSAIAGKFGIDQTTPGTTNLVSIGTNGTVQTKAPLNSTGSGSAAAATVSTVITLTAPANAVGAFLMNIDTSTANIRWAVNRTATATLGQQLQPGRDVWIPTTTNISLVAESGTQTYDVQWISQ